MPLDDIDVIILNKLIKNARISYTDIAKEVGMKPPSVIDRIKKMENEGIITEYTAKVDYRKLGYDMIAFVGIVMENPSYIEDFEKIFLNVDDDIIECFHVTGEYTLLIKILTKNTDSLAAIIRKLRDLPGVISTNTILVFSTMINRTHTL